MKERDAGLWLNARVASELLGWKLVHWSWEDGSWTRNSAWPPHLIAQLDATHEYALPGWVAEDAAPDVQYLNAIHEQRGYPLPDFSTDLAATQQVIQAMHEQPVVALRVLRLVSYPYNRTYATFERDEDDWTEANGEHHLPLAICLAALDAIASLSPEKAAGEVPSSVTSKNNSNDND